MTYQHIIFEQTDYVATLTLNRPDSLNAVHPALSAELVDAADRVRDEGVARALLITGAGRGFCSGADLVGGRLAVGQQDPALVDLGKGLEATMNPFLEQLLALPMPVITAVNGPAVGVGCSMALISDIVLAARSAYFWPNFVKVGLVPDGGLTWTLPRLIGRARAQALIMLGERISAEQAEEWGLIYKAVDDQALIPTARQLAQQLASGPTKAYAMIRQGIRSALESSFTDALFMERNNQRTAGRTADFAEGAAAFREKRPPNFQGR